MVEVSGLTKVFRTDKGEVRALDGVSFVARPGRVFGLLGVNGAGKTTCLRVLSTVIHATSGTATVMGHDVVRDSAKVRASIGFLSTSTALYGRLSARESLRYFGGLYGLSPGEVDARIAEASQRLVMDEFLDRLCDKLSTGQKQRVSIARAMLHDPPVVFFDEPTAGLDVVMAQTILEFIEECRERGKTVIFSTHIMSEVDRLCDDVVVIHQGLVKGSGTPAEIRALAGEDTMEKTFLRLVDYRSA